METSNFLITDYIKDFNDTETFRNVLFKKGIMSKSYPEENLMLVYTKFEESTYNNTNTPLKNECRSLVIDTEKEAIVSYTCNTPICNLEAMNYLLKHNENKMKVYECFEGTLMSLFHHKDKWFLSTRRCLDSKKSVWNNNSHYDLFIEVLNTEGYENLEQFTEKLDNSYCYNFILIHHKNNNIVDYSSRFGENYKKLCLAFIRKKDDLSEIEYNEMNNFLPENKGNFFIPIEFESLSNFNSVNNIFEKDSMLNCSEEGVVIKIKNDNNINIYLKLQTYSYQFNKAIGSEKNIFKGFISLYQNDKLASYLEKNNNLVNYKKIVNPLNTQESYDTIGVVDSVFKVCTSELFELFKLLWNLKSGKQLNQNDNTLYNMLPKEYKTLLYGIRGIYFKNKSSVFNSSPSTKKIYLQIKDIYQHIKAIDINTLEQFLRVRKLMLNWVRVDQTNEQLKEFKKISDKCDNVHFKLTAIFTNKLFPNIMPDDLPDKE